MTIEDYASAFFETATAFRFSAVLFAGLELDIFSVIPDTGATAEEVAQQLKVEELPLRLLLNTLVAMGVLAKTTASGRFLVPPAYAPLLRQGPDYYGDRLLFEKEQVEYWLRLADLVRGHSSEERFYDKVVTTSRIETYLKSIQKTNQPYADEMLEHLRGTIAKARRVLDIGGGHGYYATRVLELNETAIVTVLDLEKSIEYCQACQRANPNYHRFEFVIGNALTHTYMDEFDLVMLNDVIHYFSADEKREVVRRGIRALREGGVIAVSTFRLAESGVEPPPAALFSLRIFINTEKGYLPTTEQTVALLREAGARDIQARPLGDLKTLVTGVR